MAILEIEVEKNTTARIGEEKKAEKRITPAQRRPSGIEPA